MRLVALLPWLRNDSPANDGLDMGEGRRLAPEDVLDGHSTRLIANRQQPQARTTVPVQVKDGVSVAITVLAPELAPLATLAEQVAFAVPAVSPEPIFRRNLYEALERTHRQHRVEELLGTRSTYMRKRGAIAVRLVTISALLSIIISTWFAWRWLRRND